jgi:glycine/D-amino acid oxidase-like deaminating enzyme
MKSPNQKFEKNSWINGVTLSSSMREFKGDRKAQFVVVGAGFSGVSSARRLAHLYPNEQIILLEAGGKTDGSSSRSSGFIVSLGQFERASSVANKRFYEHGVRAIRDLKEIVAKFEIDCDWLDGGRVVAARGELGNRSLGRMENVLLKIDSPFVKLDGNEIKSRTGMSGYRAGIQQLESVMVNPAKLLDGLRSTLPKNVELYHNSPVLSVSRLTGGGHLLKLEKGVVKCQKALVTSNAFCLKMGYGLHRVFPMRTFVSVANFDRKVGVGDDENWGLTSPERVGSSLRRVGNRVFIRNSAHYGFEARGNSKDQLSAISEFQSTAIERRFPNSKVEIENTWSGVIGITANGGQIFKQVEKGIYLSTGYNGHGIAQGTTSGKLLADLAGGVDSKELREMISVKKPSWIPAGLVLRAGVFSYCKFLERRYRDEI